MGSVGMRGIHFSYMEEPGGEHIIEERFGISARIYTLLVKGLFDPLDLGKALVSESRIRLGRIG